MHVAVVIVGYRNPGDIVVCLAALEKSEHRDFEVIICENGGAAAFAELQANIPAMMPGGQKVTMVSAPDNPGFAGGVNIGIAATPDADAWWVLNPDTEPMPGAMAAMVARLERGDVDATGGTLVAPEGFVQSHGGQWRTWFARAVSIGYGSARSVPVDTAAIERRQNYIIGASMMVTNRFVAVAGPMREDYFLYCEEVEWSVRAARHGLKLSVAPGAVVLHHQGTTTGAAGSFKSRSKLSVYLSNRNMMLMTRDLYPLRLPVAIFGGLAGMLVSYGRRGAWRQLGFAIEGMRAGLANERGVPAWMRAPA
jgi:GT2 family glycosyltransferase